MPRRLMMEIVVESLDYHRANIGTELADSAVLNACRALRFAAEDRWTSKPAAGSWALERSGDLDAELVRMALDTHRQGRSSAMNLPTDRVERFLAHACRSAGRYLE